MREEQSTAEQSGERYLSLETLYALSKQSSLMINVPTTFDDEAQLTAQWRRSQFRLQEGATALQDANRTTRARRESLELQEQVWELEDEVQILRDQLARSRALNRFTLVRNKGLIDTVRHLRKSWDPSDAAELEFKSNITPLVNSKIQELQADQVELQKIDDEIAEATKAEPVRRKSSDG